MKFNSLSEADGLRTKNGGIELHEGTRGCSIPTVEGCAVCAF